MPVTKRVLYFLFFLPAVLCGQHLNLKFENFDTTQGLSSSTCLEIYQDKEGFLWFGTIDGLNRFDGYTFEVYRPSIKNPNTISNNRINAIVEDNAGRLWVGTSNGLNLFDKKKQLFYKVDFEEQSNDKHYREIINALCFDSISNTLFIGSRSGLISLSLVEGTEQVVHHPKFKRFVNTTGNVATLDNNSVTDLLIEGRNLWALTEGNHLNKFDIKRNSIQRFEINKDNTGFFNHLPKRFVLGKDNTLWIGNDASSLYLFDIKASRFQLKSFLGKRVPIFDLYADEKGIVWVLTDGDGIYLVDGKKGIIQHILHDFTDPYSLSNNQTSKILRDKSGIYWVATYNKGVDKLALSKSLFGHYYYKAGDKRGLSTKIAQSVLQDTYGNIWIGTDGGGLNLFNETQKTFTYYRADPGNPNSLSSDKILCMMQGNEETLWVGTWDGGLNEFNIRTKNSRVYKFQSNDPFSIGQNTVWCLAKDEDQHIWLGTSTAGLNALDPVTGKFYQFKNNPQDSRSLINNFVFSLCYDSKGRMLIGTAQGLCYAIIPKKGGIPKSLRFDEVPIENISNNRVNYITEDSKHDIWVGTDVGLYVLSENLKFKKFYSTENGLVNNLIVGIQEDNQNNIWISSKGGLSIIDRRNNNIRNFNVHDGLQGVEYQSKSICKNSDGKIMAGGINGFNLFNPKDMVPENDHIELYINELRLFNKKINAGDTLNNRIVLDAAISKISELNLKYNEGYVSFGFVALNYENPDRVKYAYRLIGLDDNFIEVADNRVANYSNLAPGTYSFEVMAAVDGNWKNAKKAVLPVVISPPIWKTWWAYIFYCAAFALALWYGIKYYTHYVREEKERELDQMKLRFFMNVSHEFRTPLTLILNPVEKVLANYKNPEEVKNAALIIQRSSSRLLYLVNQLLDFRKVESGEAELDLHKKNIEVFLRDIVSLFEDLAAVKGIRLEFESKIKSKTIFFDPDKVEKMLTNLLSNAIKFTGAEGKVSLRLSEVQKDAPKSWFNKFLKRKAYYNYIKISVTDTGMGFKKGHEKKIFKRFFHPDSAIAGTGIGLNYTKSLVELHKGSIKARSVEGKGSVFSIFLPTELKPLGKKAQYIIDDRLTTTEESAALKSLEYELAIEDGSNDSPDLRVDQDGIKPLLLVVDDNKELRTHLMSELSVNYRIKEATNGATGLEMVRKYFPDVVISDIMMPQMDGFEMCRQIKEDTQTSHIPVILLTARSLEEDQIKGYNTGADKYVCKPFRLTVLEAQIKNVLTAKKKIRERFATIGVLPASETTSSTADEMFIDKATKVVLDNISNAELTLEDVLNQMGIGRSQFFRKINTITGQNPSNFIRTIRLKKAAKMLREQQHPIKQIAFMCGFSSATYFAKTFKDLYGTTPRDFLTSIKKEKMDKNQDDD